MNQYDLHYLLFQAPLYEKWFVPIEDEKKFLDLMLIKVNYNEYSPILKENTTYQVSSQPYDQIRKVYPPKFDHFIGFHSYTLQCLRSKDECDFYFYFGIVERDGFIVGFYTKVGQYPSLADFEISAIKDYKPVLSNEKLKEFTRAIGLAANGIGIGSFVYLRRIFEHLIEEAHGIALTDSGWDEDSYSKGRIAEKIELLSKHLPSFLVENKGIYSILSKGIHELTEDECLGYFEAVKAGIEIILDEKLEMALKKKKLEEAKRKIDAIKTKI